MNEFDGIVGFGHPTLPHPSSDAFAATNPSLDAACIKPLFDYPIRDTSICLAPDGFYYLTGTSGTPDFWFENDGIRIWRSPDLVSWEALGMVYDIEKDGTWNRERKELAWYERQNGVKKSGRALWAPEIHYLKGTFWLTFCMNYGGTGLLRSQSGKATGPYQDMGRITDTKEIDASLFEDDDGAVYWVWQNGMIARMKDDMTGLAEKPRLLQPEPYIFNHLRAEKFKTKFNPDGRTQVGFEGAFIFKHEGKYHLAVAEDFRRFGEHCYDCFIAVASSVYGPYSSRYLAIPHAGHSTFFHDKSGRLYCTAFGSDDVIPHKHRPMIVPLSRNSLGMITPDPSVIMEGGAVGSLKPVLKDFRVRDPQVCLAPDGFYYMTGTSEFWKDKSTGIELYRSKDLVSWESLGFVWKLDPDGWQSNPPKGRERAYLNVWAPEIHALEGTFYIAYSMNWICTGLLVSISGKPEGPYEDIGKITDGTIDPSIFVDDDLTAYFVWQGGLIAPLSEDRKSLKGEPVQLLTVDGEKVGYEGAFIVKIDNYYVLGCAEWNGDLRVDGTYDLIYATSKELMGTYTKRRVAVRHGGHGTFFRSKDGTWMSTIFGNDRTAPFRTKFGIVTLRVWMEDGELRVEA